MDRKITALKVQKRNPNRISIHLDGIYTFGVERIVGAWLQVGQELSEEQIAALQEKDNIEIAYQKALRYLSYRARSESEVRRKLISQGFSETIAVAIIKRMKEKNFIGDDEFARIWVENRTAFRPRSRRVLAIELRTKGVAEKYIQSALTEADDDDTLTYKAASQYAHRLSRQEWPQFQKKLTAYLRRRGFIYGMITPVVHRVWSELQSDKDDTNYQEMRV